MCRIAVPRQHETGRWQPVGVDHMHRYGYHVSHKYELLSVLRRVSSGGAFVPLNSQYTRYSQRTHSKSGLEKHALALNISYGSSLLLEQHRRVYIYLCCVSRTWPPYPGDFFPSRRIASHEKRKKKKSIAHWRAGSGSVVAGRLGEDIKCPGGVFPQMLPFGNPRPHN